MNDDEILDLIFNPNGAIGKPVNKQQPPSELQKEPWKEKYSSDLIIESSQLEIKAIKLAEEKKLDEALKIFDEMIEKTPLNPSIYNNRAQVYQLQGKVDEALKDLNKCIDLCEGSCARVAKQAYTQRGLIKELKGDEEDARLDFEIGSQLGNKLAREESVKLNPYAKMCNQMLQQAMKTQDWV